MYAASDGQYTLFIEPDGDPINPREEGDSFGKMVCWHSRYSLGDMHNHAEPVDFLRELLVTTFAGNVKPVLDYVKSPACASTHLAYDRATREWVLSEKWPLGKEPKWYEVRRYEKPLYDDGLLQELLYDIAQALSISDLTHLLEQCHNLIMLPLYLYDHSGITMNTSGFSCPWDSGQVGWIYADGEIIAKEFGEANKASLVKAKQMLLDEVRTYDYYLRGDCCGFRLYESGEEIDSCWGFLGDLDDMKEAVLDYLPEVCKHLVDKLEPWRGSVQEYLRNAA